MTVSGIGDASLSAAPGDLVDPTVREVSFSYTGSQLVVLASAMSLGPTTSAFQFYDVNSSNTAIGTSRGTPVSLVGGTIHKLGGLEQFLNVPLVPRGINAGGAIVGYARVGDGGDAILWISSKAYNLNDLLGRSSWHITRAYGIDTHGDIVAYGRLNGRECPLLLLPADS